MNNTLVDFHGEQKETTGDYLGLLALARQLLSERILFARRSYPDELKVHFGTPVEEPAPNGRTLTRGSYVLGAVSSSWALKIARQGVCVYSGDPLFGILKNGSHTPSTSIDEENLDELLDSTGGMTVSGVDVNAHPFGYALSLATMDGSLLTITPTPEEVSHSDDGRELPSPPDWELFTPYDRYLRVGPGPKWAYLASDKPE